MSERRIHHLHGVEQVTIPDGYTDGVLASLLVDTSGGFTCIDQIGQIEQSAKEQNQSRRNSWNYSVIAP